MEQNSDEFIRSRYALYSFASRAEELGLLQSNEYSSHLRFDPKMLYQDFGLRELFAESAELIRGLEADLEYKSGGNHLPTWKKWLDRAYDLKETAKTEFIKKMDLDFIIYLMKHIILVFGKKEN